MRRAITIQHPWPQPVKVIVRARFNFSYSSRYRKLMSFALTTRWNAARHYRREAMLKEILALGIRHIELGYDLRMDLVPGVLEIVKRGEVWWWTACTTSAQSQWARTAATRNYSHSPTPKRACARARSSTPPAPSVSLPRVGAQAVVIHAGHCHMHRMSEELFRPLRTRTAVQPGLREDQAQGPARSREAGAPAGRISLPGIEQMLPVLQETRVKLGIENLPTWRSIPTESEMEELFRHSVRD
jgi:hypothetical protein